MNPTLNLSYNGKNSAHLQTVETDGSFAWWELCFRMKEMGYFRIAEAGLIFDTRVVAQTIQETNITTVKTFYWNDSLLNTAHVITYMYRTAF